MPTLVNIGKLFLVFIIDKVLKVSVPLLTFCLKYVTLPPAAFVGNVTRVFCQCFSFKVLFSALSW